MYLRGSKECSSPSLYILMVEIGKILGQNRREMGEIIAWKNGESRGKYVKKRQEMDFEHPLHIKKIKISRFHASLGIHFC